MHRSILVVLAVLGAVSASAHAAKQPPAERSTTLQWQMNLDEHGQVSELSPHGEGIDALRTRLEPAIRGWEFVPGKLDGKPTATQTLLSVELGLQPSEDGSEYVVRIRSARTGGTVADASVPPRFPAASMTSLLRERDSYNVMVVVEVRYDAAGKAIAVSPAAGTPVQKGPLLDSVSKAVKRWTYQPELIAGVGVPGTLVVPVCFALASDMAKARQQSKRCSWTQPGTQVSVAEGDSLALDSSVQLKTVVADRVL